MDTACVVEAQRAPGLLRAAHDAINAKRATISVAIPVYNEAATVLEVVRRVKEVDREKEIIIVDDCSSDGTAQVLEQFRGDDEVKVFRQEENRGKGAALRRAFAAAKNEVVIIQDADLEYDPQDYEALLSPIEQGLADVVYGSRYLPGPRRVLPFWHSVVNRLLTTFSNAFTDIHLTDMETCYKVFRREIIQNVALTSNRFGFEPEVTAKLARIKCSIYEVPIHYNRRAYDTGKKITWRDGVAALWHIVRFSLTSERNKRNDRGTHAKTDHSDSVL